jgi:hypothetical protein
MKNFGRIISVTIVLLAIVSFPVSAKLKKRTLATGVWGGQHISFEVSAKGAKIEYDCAHATIDRAIVVDGKGHFNVSGRQFPERGGPVREGDQPSYAVVFSGEVKGQTMTLNVRNSSTREYLGTFTLAHGAQPELFKCK